LRFGRRLGASGRQPRSAHLTFHRQGVTFPDGSPFTADDAFTPDRPAHHDQQARKLSTSSVPFPRDRGRPFPPSESTVQESNTAPNLAERTLGRRQGHGDRPAQELASGQIRHASCRHGSVLRFQGPEERGLDTLKAKPAYWFLALPGLFGCDVPLHLRTRPTSAAGAAGRRDRLTNSMPAQRCAAQGRRLSPLSVTPINETVPRAQRCASTLNDRTGSAKRSPTPICPLRLLSGDELRHRVSTSRDNRRQTRGTRLRQYRHDIDRRRAALLDAGAPRKPRLLGTMRVIETVTAAQSSRTTLHRWASRLNSRTVDSPPGGREDKRSLRQCLRMGWLCNIDPDASNYDLHNTPTAPQRAEVINAEVDYRFSVQAR